MKNSILVLLLIAAMACSKEKKENEGNNACAADDPMSVEWLLAIKDSLNNCACELSIFEGVYMEQTVFFIAITDPLCDAIDLPTLFNCTGDPVKTFTLENYLEFYTDVKRSKVLYRCKSPNSN